MSALSEQFWTLQCPDIIRHVIMNTDSIAIAGHINPDGDSIGSLLSLGTGLEILGKRVYMLSDDPIPMRYMKLPGISRIVKWCPQNIDLAIAVDCGSKDMLGSIYTFFQYAEAILEIDHHQCRVPFGDYSIIDTQASSAGELIYTLLCDLDIPITIDIAWNILTSIIVETNSFRLPDLNPRTFEICAELLKTGVDFNKLTEMVYWNTSKTTAILSGIALSRCNFSKNGELAWAILTRRDFEKTGSTDADADPIPEKIRSIYGVKIAILFRETKTKKWRISFRSKDEINVAYLAEIFGGGGHLSAAGCTIKMNKRILKKILSYASSILDSRHKENQISFSHNCNPPFFTEPLPNIKSDSDILFLETVPAYIKEHENLGKCSIK